MNWHSWLELVVFYILLDILIVHFRVKSFQAIDCTATHKQIYTLPAEETTYHIKRLFCVVHISSSLIPVHWLIFNCWSDFLKNQRHLAKNTHWLAHCWYISYIVYITLQQDPHLDQIQSSTFRYMQYNTKSSKLTFWLCIILLGVLMIKNILNG